ncbi:MAG: hypothetical protein Q8P59_07000 [Dehalococcoidia bacterium]|nr:hypothetical protein [Dehalococcoidia bacterium]
MPYKNSEEQKKANKEANKRWRDKRREGITEGITKEGITGEGITLPLAWQAVKDYLKRDNLVKMQAICGSLGKYGEQVYFGGLNIQEVGAVIGSGPPVGHEVFSAPLDRDYCGRLRGPMDIRDVTPLCKRTDEHAHLVVHA